MKDHSLTTLGQVGQVGQLKDNSGQLNNNSKSLLGKILGLLKYKINNLWITNIEIPGLLGQFQDNSRTTQGQIRDNS